MLEVPPAPVRADVGVFGGSGLYSLLDHLEPVEIETPYGPPSEAPVVGEVGGRRVAFIPRHGENHRLPAHVVNYRANAWALAALGVRAVIGPFACGSLRRELAPGDLVVVDQASGGGTDAAYAALRTKAPVIESFGVQGTGSHTADQEHIVIDSIVPRLYLLTRMIMDVAQGKDR